jgi:hypothetical protein
MVSIFQDRTAPLKHAVHSPRQPCPNRLHPTPERLCIPRFDNHVDMILLDRVVNHSEIPAIARSRKRSLELAHQTLGTQRRHALPHLQRHMAGMTRGHRLPREMRNPGIRTRPATRALPLPSPAGVSRTRFSFQGRHTFNSASGISRTTPIWRTLRALSANFVCADVHDAAFFGSRGVRLSRRTATEGNSAACHPLRRFLGGCRRRRA